MTRHWGLICLGLTLTGAAQAQTVTVGGLLKQMTDLNWLTHRPRPYFTAAQASSYDRASKSPRDQKTWFANGDAGQYIRIEERDGRKEYVMADLKGPGAVVRVWSANPAGVLRFYFDGETTARFEANTADLLTGKIAPFSDPFAYMASMGTNLYFPFPYAKSLKVTVDNSGDDKAKAMYYEVGYRTYESATAVQTFDPSQLSTVKAAMAAAKANLQQGVPVRAQKNESVKGRSSVGVRKALSASSGGVLQVLQVKIPFPLVQTIRPMDWTDAYQPHNVLRRSILTIKADGELCVKAPLGDFFGTAAGVNAYRSYPMSVAKDGTLTCYFPMPFKKKLDIAVAPPKGLSIPISLNLKWSPRKFEANDYYFRAFWSTDIGSTRPFRDMSFLNTTGEGLWVGTSLHVSNPTSAWWGEGDEKVWVDQESFPSTFGTGTEDYFGYAWCSPNLFSKPYHGQPRCDGPGNFGHTNVHRWQTFDPISFEKSLRFDMEMWHWQAVEARFAHTAYWYAKPGAKTPYRAFTGKELEVVELKPSAPVKGAIEGENLKVEKTGGATSRQSGFYELSAGNQLWWIDAAEGDKLTIRVPVKKAGRYEVIGHFCHANDYGIHSLRFLKPDGSALSPATTIDFYGEGVTWKKISLGTYELPAGEVILEVVSKGHRAIALPRNMFGLDYLLLNRK